MSQEPITVTFTLEEMFSRLEQKIDKQSEITVTAINKLEQKIDTVKDKLEDKIDKLEDKIDKLEVKINKQSEEITGIKSTLQAQQPLIQKMPDLAEKVGELKNWRQIVIITITAIISGSITWVIRGVNIKP